jgi:hypothetical protein
MLSERREIARARKAMKRAEKVLGSLSPQELSAFKARCVNKTAHQIAISTTRDMFALQLREQIVKDDIGVPADVIDCINGDNIEEILSMMVEGDEIIDDGATHQSLRKLLDDLREMVAKLEDQEANLKSLSYDEIQDYPVQDLATLAETMQLDFGTGVRITHFRYFGAMAIDLGKQSGVDPEKIGEGPANTLWALAAFKTIVENLARGDCSPAQIAEAMGVPETAVNEVWADHLAQVGVPQLHQ